MAHGTSLEAVAGALLGSGEYQTASTGLSGAQFVDTMYHQVLGRPGEDAGEHMWQSYLDQGGGRGGLVDAFTGSPEFQSKHAGQSNGAYVEALYEHILGRTGDPGGLQIWTNSLDAHTTTRGDVAHLFAASAEFQTRYVSPADASFVDSLYENALGRPADLGGLQTWTTALAHGAGRADVAASVAESAEAQQHLVSFIARAAITWP